MLRILLVLLTDVDGLYTGDPRRDPAARRLETVEEELAPTAQLLAHTAAFYQLELHRYPEGERCGIGTLRWRSRGTSRRTCCEKRWAARCILVWRTEIGCRRCLRALRHTASVPLDD